MPPTRRHRELLSAIALVLVPTLIVSMVVRVLVAGDDTTIINSHLLIPTPLDASRWIDFAITTGGWLWALTTGVLVMTGTLRGKEVCPTAAARQALRSLPTITFVLLIFAVVTWAALQILAAIWPLLLAGLVVAVVLLARAMMVVPTTALRLGAFWQVSSGRGTGVVLGVLLGVALPAVVAGWVVPFARDLLTEGGLPGGLFFGLVAEVLDAIVFLLVVAIQASTLARVCLHLLEDFTATDQTLDELGTSRLLPRWQVALAAGLGIPALISAGVVAADPYDRPTVRVNEMSLNSEVVAVAWPAGQHPIIIVGGGFLDCQDDECRDYQLRNEFATAVTPKGDVLAASAKQSGEITIKRCTRSGQCQSGKLSRPGSDRLGIEVAIAQATDGSFLIASARDTKQHPFESELALIRCADIACAEPKRTVLGKVKGGVAQSTFGHEDQTLVQFRETRAVFSIDSAVYEATPEGKLGPGKHVGKGFAAFERPVAGYAWLNYDYLNCDQGCRPRSLGGYACCLNGQPTALALNVSPQGLTAVINYPAGPPPGLRISIGKPLGTRRQTVVFLLPDARSERTQKIPLRLTDHAPQRVLIATNPDGRVFLVEQGRQTFAVTLTPGHQPR